MNLETLIGTIGSILILIAFILNQVHKWKDTYKVYDFFNFLGSIFLLIYAISLESYPFIVINTLWAIVSLRDLIKSAKN